MIEQTGYDTMCISCLILLIFHNLRKCVLDDALPAMNEFVVNIEKKVNFF